jgi:hypothetical protein
MAPGISLLLTTELSERINAPASNDAGMKKRWSSPISRRAMCAPTSPTKPMVPTNATGKAASRLTRISVCKRSRRTSTPARRLVVAQAQCGECPACRANTGMNVVISGVRPLVSPIACRRHL